jgi:rhamnosyltransferase subunit B
MKCILTAIGSAGDVYPMIGIGRGMASRGHDVVLIANEHFAGSAERAGLRFVAFGSEDEYLRIAGDPELWHARRGFRTIASTVAAHLRTLYDLIAAEHMPGRTIGAATTLALAARIAQDHLRFPLATVHLQPSIFRSVIDPADYGVWMPRSHVGRRVFFRLVDLLLMDAGYRRPVNRLRRELGLGPIGHVNDYWHAPTLSLGLFPAWYAPPPPDWPNQTRVTGFPLYDESDHQPLDPALATWLNEGEPPIVFTWGSAMMHAHEHFAMAAQACETMRRRGLLLTRFERQIPARLPDGVRHAPYAPFSTVFPRCAAVVHHGGIGTTSQALAVGTPQLITPFSHDQPDNALRVRRLGAGASLRPKHLTAPHLTAALDKLIHEPQIAANARRCAQRLSDRDAGIRATCDLLEAMA